MKKLVIIGAGGFGRSIYHLATQSNGYKTEFEIKGFIDDNQNALNNFSAYPHVINTIAEYTIDEQDVFACSIGNVETKKKVIEFLTAKGAVFITLIHNSANIGPGVSIGKGCIVGINTIIDADAIIKDYSLIQSGSVIGHDAKIGNFCRIDCNVICVGGVIISDEVTIHSSAVINHNVTVEKNAIVGAGSFVIRKVKEFTTVMGSPAINLK